MSTYDNHGGCEGCEYRNGCMGNVDKKLSSAMKRAAKEEGIEITLLDKLPCHPCAGSVGVITDSPHKDHGKFWRRVDEIGKA